MITVLSSYKEYFFLCDEKKIDINMTHYYDYYYFKEDVVHIEYLVSVVSIVD